VVVAAVAPPPGAPAGADAGGAARAAAAAAGAAAAELGARELVLWQPAAAFLDAPEAADAGFVDELLAAARSTFGEAGGVSLAGSHEVHSWGREEARGPPPALPAELAHLVDAAEAARAGSDAPRWRP
jgi:hypothetical protein